MTIGRPARRSAAPPPVAVERPATEAELVAIVKQAAAGGHRVRAVGRYRAAAGSGGPGSTEGILIDLANYRRILRVDRRHQWAMVQAGITLRALHRGLAARGLALANGPDEADQSIGAAISAGAHGTGARFAGMAAEIAGLELVTAGGEVVECSAEQAPDVFGGARVGMGALGVISTVTLRCVAAFNLRPETGVVRLDDLLAHFDDEAERHDHFELSWLAGTGWTRTFRANRTDEARGAGRSYRVFPTRQPSPGVVEYSLPRSAAVAAIGELRARIGSHRPTPFPIRVRISAGDDIALSTATGRPSAYVTVPVGPLSALVDSLGGRPQWTSRHGATAATLRGRYPRWDEWHAVRQRLDPERRFANAFTEVVLGP